MAKPTRTPMKIIWLLDNVILADPTDECVEFPVEFGRTAKGYGAAINGVRPHQQALILSGAPRPDPPGDHALHSCPNGDNKACVNPRHLRWGGNQSNVNDKMSRTGVAWQVLSEADVAAIRQELIVMSPGVRGGNARELAARFGISVSHVRSIGNRSKR